MPTPTQINTPTMIPTPVPTPTQVATPTTVPTPLPRPYLRHSHDRTYAKSHTDSNCHRHEGTDPDSDFHASPYSHKAADSGTHTNNRSCPGLYPSVASWESTRMSHAFAAMIH